MYVTASATATCAIKRVLSASGKLKPLIASVAVPIAALWVSEPDISPAAKPGSSPSILAIAIEAARPVAETTIASNTGFSPSRFSDCMNCGPTE